MLVTVLKSFPYSADGLTSRVLDEGAVEEIHDALVNGLVAEGFVEAGAAPVVAAPETLSAEGVVPSAGIEPEAPAALPVAPTPAPHRKRR